MFAFCDCMFCQVHVPGYMCYVGAQISSATAGAHIEKETDLFLVLLFFCGILPCVGQGLPFHLCEDALFVEITFTKARITVLLHQLEDLESPKVNPSLPHSGHCRRMDQTTD